MSKMRSDRKPPLANAKSPPRLRPPRRILRSNTPALQTPPGSLTKSAKPIRNWNTEESDLRPEYHSISCELRDLAKMVQAEFGAVKPDKAAGLANCSSAGANPSSSLFERGRLYDEYSARRNERLKRKMGQVVDEPKTAYSLGVNVESSKRRDSKKRESLRKSVAVAYSVERSETPRYSLRSMSKENKKPPLPLYANSERSALAGDRKTGTRRVRKI